MSPKPTENCRKLGNSEGELSLEPSEDAGLRGSLNWEINSLTLEELVASDSWSYKSFDNCYSSLENC